MALIRCPQCDTLHELAGTFFANGPRKVRCAECRTVWEARDIDSIRADAVVPDFDIRTNSEPRPPADAEAEPSWDEVPAAALNQAEIDAIDFSLPAEPQAEDRAISPEELEALFADDPKPAASVTAERPSALDMPIVVPAAMASGSVASGSVAAGSLAAGNTAAGSLAETPVDKLAAEPEETGNPEERRANRRKNRRDAAAFVQNEARAHRRTSMTGIVLAAGIGSLAMLGILRHETVRLFPQTAPLFSAVGLGVTQHLLDINDVRSRLTRENGLDTLEVTGTIANLSKSVQKLPILRLSIRSNGGQEIYVWTAAADQGELGPGEKTTFRRRLASPPAESHSVMVRFVAKDDIVAAIR